MSDTLSLSLIVISLLLVIEKGVRRVGTVWVPVERETTRNQGH
jgi:hypothetical protein